MYVIIYFLINLRGTYKWQFPSFSGNTFFLTATSKQWVRSFLDKVSFMFIFLRNSRMLMEGSNLINFVMRRLKSCSSNSLKLCWILFNALISISELLFSKCSKNFFSHLFALYTFSSLILSSKNDYVSFNLSRHLSRKLSLHSPIDGYLTIFKLFGLFFNSIHTLVNLAWWL